MEGELSRAFVSYPARFKHLAFDGRFLHGVPEFLTRGNSSSGRDGEKELPENTCPQSLRENINKSGADQGPSTFITPVHGQRVGASANTGEFMRELRKVPGVLFFHGVDMTITRKNTVRTVSVPHVR